MQLVYGNSFFPVDGVECTTFTQARKGGGGRPYQYDVKLRGKVQFIAKGAQELSGIEVFWRNSLLQTGLNFVLLDDNNVETSIALKSDTAASISPGVVITNIRFPEAKNGELVTGRVMEFTAEASYKAPSTANVIEYHETVSITGTGGPKVVTQEAINGPVVFVRTSAQTVSHINQTGNAVGFLGYPDPPGLVMSEAYLINQKASIRREAPKMNGTSWKISWDYKFQYPGALPIAPVPNIFLG